MQRLKRIRYDTMNSWNQSKAPAYNLKVHEVADRNLQDKIYEMMESEEFYDDINWLISDFNTEMDYEWQAGFNGRSGGYLVLYRGGRKLSEHKSRCTLCGQRNFTSVEDTGKICGVCNQETRVDQVMYETFTWPGREIEDDEVPGDVKRAFRRLAIQIVKDTEYKAKNFVVEEEEYQVTKTRKILREA